MVHKIMSGRDFKSIVAVSVLRKESVFHLPDLFRAFSPQDFLEKS